MTETVNRTGMIHRKRRPMYASTVSLSYGFGQYRLMSGGAGRAAGPPVLVAEGD